MPKLEFVSGEAYTGGFDMYVGCIQRYDVTMR